ncbi:MAG: ferrous iron transport protein A [Candidatus Omnitrophica bacterium]|nr:ferrous iron transport protein A [Candidatus Omnitrophota bacterium]MBU4479287.1 ferrous iron transport protein A [Candidatus Omnitrophota bacterium]MCG2703268.1 ferrous iron transport protein A [Candidatus Omnitrophota bacterium]
MNKINLVQMKAGQKGTIVRIEGAEAFSKRLGVMGMRIDKSVIKLSAFVFCGPVAIRVGRTVIALGYGMASKVWVQLEKK